MIFISKKHNLFMSCHSQLSSSQKSIVIEVRRNCTKEDVLTRLKVNILFSSTMASSDVINCMQLELVVELNVN